MNNFEVKIEKLIEELAISVAKGFSDQNDKFEKRFIHIENKFDGLETRFDKLEKDNKWIKDILEKQSSTLERLDQERIFSLNYINRLEAEVEKIKRHLKIAQ